jgi:hypothetical protein
MKAKKGMYLIAGVVASVSLAVLLGILLQVVVEAFIGVVALCTILVLFLGLLAG